jgi:hypothetical protein
MDRGEFRELGYPVVELLADYLEHIEEKPAFPNVEPTMLTKLLAEPLPQGPSSAEKVLSELEAKLLPYCTHAGHPGYMGLVTPSPDPVGVIALISSTLKAWRRWSLDQHNGQFRELEQAILNGVTAWRRGPLADDASLNIVEVC